MIANQITLAQARQMAEDAVARDMAQYENPVKIEQLLENEFLEAENCWIFFRNKEISVLPDSWFVKSYNAFAISKKGAFSQITSLEYDREQLNAYLKAMSDYFGLHGE